MFTMNAAAVGDPMDVRTWGVWDPLRPHLERITRLGDEEGIPEPTAGLMNQLGRLLNYKGLFAAAESLFRRALEIDEASFGPEHPKVAIRLNNLAQLLQATNRLAEAEPLMRRALAIFEASLGPDHPSTLTVRGNLAAPVLYGEVEVDPGGRVVYNSTDYEVERGRLDTGSMSSVDVSALLQRGSPSPLVPPWHGRFREPVSVSGTLTGTPPSRRTIAG